MQVKDFQTTKKCTWYILWHRYLNDNPGLYGQRITADELDRLTSNGQCRMPFNGVKMAGKSTPDAKTEANPINRLAEAGNDLNANCGRNRA